MSEARVLTLDEVQKLGHREVVWLEVGFEGEDNLSAPVDPMIVCANEMLLGEGRELRINERIYDPVSMFFGGARRFRLWTSPPTVEQRKAVAWDA